MTARPRRPVPGRLALAGTAVLACVCLAGCDAASSGTGPAPHADPSASATPAPPVRLRLSASDLHAVPLAAPLRLSAEHGTLTGARLVADDGTRVAGELDDGRWRATGRLEPGTAYVLRGTARDEAGESVTRAVRFRTQQLSLAEQTYASVAPLQGETVGVGMPVVVSFDLPVADKAAFERHMSVTSTPAQPGAWHWISDQEVHWRPRTYWRAGTDVHVDVDVNSIPAGGGVFGQESRSIDFHVGSANVYRVDAAAHTMRVFSDGKLLRTLPVTTGKPGFTTRSGTKVIMEKFATKRMNSETVGISSGGPEAYDIDDVQWAMRITHSGEFIHAAPWSVGSQGHANVSHGCTGLSTADAAWLYAMSKRGDVVEYTGTDVGMTLTNGYGDWNEDFATYRAGSALG